MLTQKGNGQKWYPKTISDIEAYLARFIVPIPSYSAKECRGLKKNIAYSIQHLEFLHRCEQDINLSTVVWTQNTKTFIIVACSVIEALFFYLLRVRGRAATTQWIEIRKVTGVNFRDENGVELRIDCIINRRTDREVFEEMTFDAMCKKVESKKLVTLGNEEFYKNLPRLRTLRNRVHIHIVKDDSDTDYLQINTKELILSKKVLLALLTSELFPGDDTELFSFLNTLEIEET